MKRLLVLFIALVLPVGAVFSQKKETYRVRTLVIDPGHGGAKPGAKGSRSWEKDITLDVAKKFGKLVADNYPDVRIIYTRTDDSDVSLAQRAHIANSNKADLFISIHANSHPTASPSGVETFVMGLSESKANLEVAKKENADILLEADYKDNQDYSGFDPNAPETYVMLAMFQNAFIDKSLNLAQAIQTQYKQNMRTINRGVKQAELYVLYKTSMPSVLTEIGFISNPDEEAFMLSDEGQAVIAISLFNAFMSYKAIEEGTAKPANPKIDLPGYGDNKAPANQPAVQQPAPQSVAQAEPAAQPQPSAPKAAEPQTDSVPVAPAPKPTPSVALPQREPQPEPQPMSQSEPQPEPEVVAQPVQQPAPQVAHRLIPPLNTAAETANQYYTVQFLVAPVLYEKGASQLGGVEYFEASRKGQSYVYTTGRFATFAEASDYCNHLHSNTPFGDAWVFLSKAPAATESAQPVAQTPSKPAQTTPSKPTPSQQPSRTTPSKPAANTGSVIYRVQFCSSPRLMNAGDPDLHGITDFHYAHSGRFYIYTAGNYSSLAAANERCKKIQQSTPFHDAYVIAIYGGSRISLERAAEIEKKNKR